MRFVRAAELSIVTHITLRLFATRGFPPTRNTNSKLCLLGLYSSLQSIRAAHEKVNCPKGQEKLAWATAQTHKSARLQNVYTPVMIYLHFSVMLISVQANVFVCVFLFLSPLPTIAEAAGDPAASAIVSSMTE